ncbi:MAG: hypothetical protein ACTHW2_12305 [Tissierella sp.]|uniref:hypothetical protein n=1 Tax=Tissierella sp. TaxID=41274 RepID=UPI003F9500BB
MAIKKVPKLTVVLGMVLIIIGFLIPYDSMEFILGQGLRPLGLVSLFINPALGIVGAGFSLYKKNWLFLLFNIIMIFTFFILMAIGYGLY